MPEGCLPGVPEVDDLMRQLNSVHQSFEQIRNAALMQQQALAEEQALANKPEPRDPGLVGFAHEMKANGEFTVGDSKKRRGVSILRFDGILLTVSRKQHHQDDATAAIEPKPPNGDAVQMGLAHSAMPVDCTTRN